MADWPGAEPAPTPLDKLPEKDRPQALDRAALEGCVGGPFFPGIEAGRIMLGERADKKIYDKNRPFRINANLLPGTLTARMAVPWQADFFACETDNSASMDWWPGQRPDHVLRDANPEPEQWRLGVSSMNEMVDKWAQLGFVIEKKTADKVAFVEDERFLEQAPPPPECDVAVLGGGPAGAAAAITLARTGRSVVVIEKSHYEQSRIGETLVPAARPLLVRLAVWEPFLAAGHLPSPGVLSVWGEDELYETHSIFNAYGQGWHLDRQRFDTMLAQAAEKPGRVSIAAHRSLRPCRSLAIVGRSRSCPVSHPPGGSIDSARSS